jgi:histidine phosphotransfer protein HptB
MSVTQHLDYNALNSLKEVMEDDFNFLIETFIQDSHDRLATLQTLVTDKNVDSIRRASHSFKGSCSNLGALRLAAMCASVERKALAGELETYSKDLAEIEEEFLIIKKLMLEFLK